MAPSTRRVALAAMLVLLSSSAYAARYTKRETRITVRGGKALALPTPSTPNSGSRAPAAPRPTLSAARFRSLTRSRVARLSAAAARKLHELLTVTNAYDPDRPDLLFRLAEHYREQKVAAEHAARALDEPIYQATDPARKARLRRQQQAHTARSERHLRRALGYYLAIYREPRFASYKRIDVVLWGLASLLVEAKRRDTARRVFSRLIRQHPQSRFVPDALLSFAEHYFASGDVGKALSLYQRVARYPSSPLYDYALYKAGWCWLNLKDPRRALEHFVRILRRSRRVRAGASQRGRIMLARVAANDAVRAYARVGTAARAYPFFRRIAGTKRAPEMMERLARLYFDHGKFRESVTTLKRLIALSPRSHSLCRWQHEILRATLPSKDKRAQLVEAKRLVAVLGLLRTRSPKKQHLQRCADITADVLRALATTWHREAQKTRDKDTYALADKLYAAYLATFPRASDVATLAFYRAELLFQLERFRRAARAYARVIEIAPRGKHVVESAWAAVIALKNALNQRDELRDTARNARAPAAPHSARRRATPRPKPIRPALRALLAACETFIKVAPTSPRVVAIRYRRARVYYEHDHYRKAAALFAELVQKHPSHELAVFSANLLLDSFNALGDITALARWVEKLLRHPILSRIRSLSTTCMNLRWQLQRKLAEKLRAQKRYRACGEAYARLANQRPDAPAWPELVYMAALCFEEAKLVGLAIAMRETLIRERPKSPLAQKALYQIGANYHALAWFSKAADYYERYARRFPGEKDASRALQNAIVFRLGRGDDRRALDAARFFARTFGARHGHGARTAAVMFSVGSATLRGKPAAEVVAYYKRYLRRWGRAGGADRATRAHVHIARAVWRASCPVRGIDGACVRVVMPKLRYFGSGSDRIRLSCGPQKHRVELLARDARLVRRARRHLDRALALARRVGAADAPALDARRGAAFRRAVGEALFIKAEAELEHYLALHMPRGLDFVRAPARARRKLQSYLRRRAAQLTAARARYREVVHSHDTYWSIAAAARVGQLFKWYADALYSAPTPLPLVPTVLRSRAARREYVDTFVTRYCDDLEGFARVPERKALGAFKQCLERSRDLSWFSSWSRLCERALNQLAPTKFPLTWELRAKPRFVRIQPDRAGLQMQVR
ncbi:MAG: tetratricopeptide repeat protein [Myxococcales bacterium]|nr:tetratricopeptide repeat protein [Myxococcales bacterium]